MIFVHLVYLLALKYNFEARILDFLRRLQYWTQMRKPDRARVAEIFWELDATGQPLGRFPQEIFDLDHPQGYWSLKVVTRIQRAHHDIIESGVAARLLPAKKPRPKPKVKGKGHPSPLAGESTVQVPPDTAPETAGAPQPPGPPKANVDDVVVGFPNFTAPLDPPKTGELGPST